MTLSWTGKGRDVSPDAAPDRATLGSWHAPDGSGWLYHGDNLTGLRRLARTHAGTFALAYLEALVRIADWRASARPSASTKPSEVRNGR